MLKGVILDRIDSISDLGIIMNSRMSFSEHLHIAVGKVLAMLGFVKRMLRDYKDSYTLKICVAGTNIDGHA
jgi:hypothetical protein